MEEKQIRTEVVEKVEEVIKDNLVHCGIFDTQNLVGDETENIYNDEENDVSVDVCWQWEYFEVFGLTDEEFKVVEEYYNSIK